MLFTFKPGASPLPVTALNLGLFMCCKYVQIILHVYMWKLQSVDTSSSGTVIRGRTVTGYSLWCGLYKYDTK